MTWNDIYNAADGAACGEKPLKVKDEARDHVRHLALDLGCIDLDYYACPEDAVKDHCNAMKIQFDESGNIVDLKLPNWVEDIIYRRKEDAYLKEDLIATAHDLNGDIEISEEQIKKMIAMYHHDEDCNISKNDTLEHVVRSIIRGE